MTKDTIYAALADIFQDIFLRSDIILRPDLSAKDVEGWDSFKMIEIILATQEHFKVKLSTKEIDGLRSVGDLAELLFVKLKAI